MRQALTEISSIMGKENHAPIIRVEAKLVRPEAIEKTSCAKITQPAPLKRSTRSIVNNLDESIINGRFDGLLDGNSRLQIVRPHSAKQTTHNQSSLTITQPPIGFRLPVGSKVKGPDFPRPATIPTQITRQTGSSHFYPRRWWVGFWVCLVGLIIVWYWDELVPK